MPALRALCPWLLLATLLSTADLAQAQSIDAVIWGPPRLHPVTSLLRSASGALAATDNSTGPTATPSTGPGGTTDDGGSGAGSGSTADDDDSFGILQWVGIAVACVFIALLLSTLTFGYVFGRAVKYAIESLDSTLLGVQITVEKVVVSVGFGFFHLSGLVVHNPDTPGRTWASEYLARMDSVTVNVNMSRLICSCGGTLEVNQMEMTDVHVAYCKPSLTETSNVQLVLNTLKSGADADATPSSSGGDDDDSGGGTNLVLQKLALKSVGAAVYFYNESIKVELADVNCDNLEGVKKKGRVAMAHWIVSIVLRTLFDSAVANCESVLASHTVGKAEAAAGRAEAAVESAAAGVGKWMGAHNPFASAPAASAEGGQVEMAER